MVQEDEVFYFAPRLLRLLLCQTLFVIPWAVAYQAPLSMGFPRQKHWSGLPFHLPGDLPNPGIKPASLALPALAGGFFTTEPPGKSALYSRFPLTLVAMILRQASW